MRPTKSLFQKRLGKFMFDLRKKSPIHLHPRKAIRMQRKFETMIVSPWKYDSSSMIVCSVAHSVHFVCAIINHFSIESVFDDEHPCVTRRQHRWIISMPIWLHHPFDQFRMLPLQRCVPVLTHYQKQQHWHVHLVSHHRQRVHHQVDHRYELISDNQWMIDCSSRCFR